MSLKIDLSYLEEVTGGSEEVIKEMLSLFLKDTPDQIALIKKNCDQKNWDEVRAEVHKLKPSFLYIGLSEAHQKLEELEANARNREDLENIPEKINFVERSFHEVQNEIKLKVDS